MYRGDVRYELQSEIAETIINTQKPRYKKDTNGDVMAKAENGWAKGVVAQGKSDVTVYGDVSAESGDMSRGVVTNLNENESNVRVE